jgi:hypothetical protein
MFWPDGFDGSSSDAQNTSIRVDGAERRSLRNWSDTAFDYFGCMWARIDKTPVVVDLSIDGSPGPRRCALDQEPGDVGSDRALHEF